MELNGEARACNVEYTTTSAMFPINLPKLRAEGNNSLNFTSTEKGNPDLDEGIEVGNVFNGCQLSQGGDEA